MKDIMFFVGLGCWLGWFADTAYYVVRGTNLLSPKVEKVVQFLAITLVTLSWYIV